MTNHTVFALTWLSCLAIGCGATDATVAPSDPVGFRFESAPGSLASFGWTGVEHAIEEPAGTPFGVETTACHDGVCEFHGPTDPGGQVKRQRCLRRMSKTCGADTDCPRDGMNLTPCVYIYDAPIAQPLRGSDGKFGACAWSYIPVNAAGQPTISGKLNLATGALDLENLTVLLAFNSNAVARTFRGACSECVNDPTPNDGIAQGTCMPAMSLGDQLPVADPDDSPDKGMPCDANRHGTLKHLDAYYSMDCSPTVQSDSVPLKFGGSFNSSGRLIQFPDDGPNCSAPGGRCFCGMCADNTTGCTSDRECGANGPCRNPTEAECNPAVASDVTPTSGLELNQCKSAPGKFAAYSNNCKDDCMWDNASGVGTCTSKSPSGATIRCYPNKDGIIVAGHAERDDHVGTVYRVNTGAASCIPAGKNAQLDSQLGLPGLLFQKRNFQIIPVYAEDKP